VTRNRFGFLLTVVFTLILLSAHSQAEMIETLLLTKGQSDPKKFTNRDIHTYQLILDKNQFVAGEAIQNGVDVEIIILNSSGSLIDTFNQFSLNKEPFHFKSKESGSFQMASASKTFTAFAIAMLADQKKLSLDDDVRKYLTWMPNFGEVITLRHLLNHSSGLKDAWNLWEMAGGRYDDIVTQQQIIEIIKNQRELNFKPGQRFQYNNGAYVLLSEVVSTVTKLKFSTWMTQNIFKPLGMKSTLIVDDHQLIVKQRAYSYESKYFGMKNLLVNKSFVGAVNVYSTAKDLSLWLRNLHTAEVGGKQVVKNMHQKSLLNDGSLKNYNLGVFLLKHKGLTKIQQGGTTAGFKSMLNYYPEIDAGVIVIGNTPDFNVRSIAHKTAEAFFANDMKIENETDIPIQIPGTASQSHEFIPLEEILLKQQKISSINDFVGTFYSDELNTTYKVVLENNRLLLKYHRGVFPLNPKEKDSFGLNNDWLLDWDLVFERDKNNKIQLLRLDHDRAHNVRFKRID